MYALDTNVLSALLTGEPSAGVISGTLNALRGAGPLVIHGSVYAELLATPGNSEERLETFLARVNIGVDWQGGAELWRLSGRAYSAYARRRSRSGGGSVRRILTDFVIGAHAVSIQATLVTLDDQHYKSAFPALPLVVPEPPAGNAP